MTARDAKVEELSAIQVGMSLANFYEDDTMWHERLVLWPSMDDINSWYILTPDFDVYPEVFDLDGSQGPSRVRIKGTTFRYWSRFSQPTYRFAEPVDDDTFRRYIEKAMDAVKKSGHWNDSKIPSTLVSRKGDSVPTSSYLGRLLTKYKTSPGAGAFFDPAAQGLLPGAYLGALQQNLKPVAPAPEGMVWISEEISAGKRLGEELDVCPGGGVMVDDTTALVQVGPGWVKGVLLRVEAVPHHVELLKKKYEALPHPEELRRDLGPPVAEEAGEKGRDEVAFAEDARILQVDYDAQEERHKEWKNVCQEAADYSFRDWPYEGPLATLHMMKMMQKSGGSPKAWLQTWSRFKQVPDQDRIMHELRTLVEALEHGGCYDQLNLPSLACFECITRRIAAIVDAFGSNAQNPDWGAARIYTGYRGPEDIVMPQLKQWASKKGREEVELQQARSKMRDLRRGVATEEAAGAVAEGALPSTAVPKRKPGRKGAGRGLQPPAQEWVLKLLVLLARRGTSLTNKTGMRAWTHQGALEIVFLFLVHQRCSRRAGLAVDRNSGSLERPEPRKMSGRPWKRSTGWMDFHHL